MIDSTRRFARKKGGKQRAAVPNLRELVRRLPEPTAAERAKGSRPLPLSLSPSKEFMILVYVSVPPAGEVGEVPVLQQTQRGPRASAAIKGARKDGQDDGSSPGRERRRRVEHRACAAGHGWERMVGELLAKLKRERDAHLTTHGRAARYSLRSLCSAIHRYEHRLGGMCERSWTIEPPPRAEMRPRIRVRRRRRKHALPK